MGRSAACRVCLTALVLWMAGNLHLATSNALAPEMTVNRKGATLEETTTSSQNDLITFECTTKTATTARVGIQQMYPTTPCGNCFSILPCGKYFAVVLLTALFGTVRTQNEASFCLAYTVGQGTLNAEQADHYQFAVICVDGTPEQNQVIKTADIYIEPNTPPYFDPTLYPEMHVSTTISQSNPITIQAVDDDGDPITYSMQLVPPSSSIVIDSVSGEIRATRDLKYECRNSFAGVVYAKDRYHNDLVGPLAVSMDVTGANIGPYITNLNDIIRVPEDLAVGTAVLPLAVFDENDYPKDLTYTLNTFPASARHLFAIVDNELVVDSALDYENQTTDITLTIQVADEYCDSELYTLTVRIVDVNEPPTLEPRSQTKESCEGRVDINPQWRVKDPDIGDIVKYTKLEDNLKGFFKINENNGIVSTTIDYDLDVEQHPSVVVHRVTVSDREGLTATATLTIRFYDCNDNAPYWQTSAGEQFVVTACDPADSVAGTLETARDDDSSYNQNNDIYYSGTGQGVRIEPSGVAVLTQQFKVGQVVTFPAYAHDQGKEPGPLTSKPYYISVRAQPCEVVTVPPVTSTPSPGYDSANAYDFWDKNLGWVVPALLLLAALLALSAYMAWRYCYPAYRDGACRNPNWCRGRPRAVSPSERPGPTAAPERYRKPESSGPGFIFGFHKETFTNEDYGKTYQEPARSEAPKPSVDMEKKDTNTFDTAPMDPNALPPEFPPPSKNCAIL